MNPLRFRQREGCDEAANRALNRWGAEKARVWRRAWPGDHHDLCVAFSGIAKHGYGARNAIDRLSWLLDGGEIEQLCHYADVARMLCRRAWPELPERDVVRAMS